MRLLVLGNSQAGALFSAYADRQLANIKIDFLVIPGGTGPTLTIRDGRPVPTRFVPEYPPYYSDSYVKSTVVSDYDAILISALGYVEGGFAFRNPISLQGLVAEFGPRKNDLAERLVSIAVLREIVWNGLKLQHGFTFLNELRACYSRRIIVQPFPLPSDAVRDRTDWNLAVCYEDPVAAHTQICSFRDDAVKALCLTAGAELLDLPDPSWRRSGFTPRALMRERDGIHMEKSYGHLVLDQIDALFN